MQWRAQITITAFRHADTNITRTHTHTYIKDYKCVQLTVWISTAVKIRFRVNIFHVRILDTPRSNHNSTPTPTITVVVKWHKNLTAPREISFINRPMNTCGNIRTLFLARRLKWKWHIYYIIICSWYSGKKMTDLCVLLLKIFLTESHVRPDASECLASVQNIAGGISYFKRMFCRLIYINITKHNHTWSLMVTEIMAWEKCCLYVVPWIVPDDKVLSIHCTGPSLSR